MKHLNLPFILAAIVLLLSVSVPIERYIATPPGKVYAGTQFYSDDYNAYIQTITQGLDGHWLVSDNFTSEPHNPSLFRIFYLLQGQFVGRPLEFVAHLLSPNSLLPISPIVYHLSRLVFGSLLLWSIWQLLKEIVPHPVVGLSAWFLILFYNILPKDIAVFFRFPIDWSLLEPYFREPEVLSRFFLQPHFMAGQAAMIYLLYRFVKLFKSDETNEPDDPKRKSWFLPKIFNSSLKNPLPLAATVTFLASWADPYPLVVLSAILWIYLLIRLIISVSVPKPSPIASILSGLKVQIVFAFVVSLALAPAAFYFEFLRTQTPWSNNSLFELSQNFSLSLNDVLHISGPLLFLAPIGLFLLFKYTRHKSYTVPLLLLSWIIAFALLFYFLSPILQINPIRIYRTPIYIPLSILAAYAIYHLSVFLRLRLRLPVYSYLPAEVPASPAAGSTKVGCLLFTVLLILPTIPSTIASLRGYYLELKDFAPLVYPPVSEVQAFNWIRSNTPDPTTIAALYEAGSLLPSFSGRATYAGNLTETLDFQGKTTSLYSFYSGQMSPTEAHGFLTGGRINYVYWGPQEKSGSLNPADYDFLQKVYSSDQVTLFKVL